MHFIGVFNKDGGTFRTLDMSAFSVTAERILGEYGHTLDVRAVDGGDLRAELKQVAQDPSADVLLAGGGDGTISAAAGICFVHSKPLAVLPAGTMNLFARSLGVPLQLEVALAALAEGELGAVDIATANGRPFVHQFSVGLHSRLVRIRNGLLYRNRWGKMLASLRAVVRALSKPLVFSAVIETRLGTERRRATAIVVSNNVLGEGHLPFAETMDRGVLGVYVVEPMPALRMARLFFRLAFGKWKADPLVSEREVTEVHLTFPHRKSSAQAVVDGELIPLAREIEVKIHAGGLRVMLPANRKLEPTPSSTAALA